MDAQFTGNGADLPVLDVKIAANLRADFRTDHEMAHLRRGMRGNGSMKRPARPQIRQRSHNAGCFCCRDCGAGGLLYRIGLLHNRMMPGKRSKGNLDPSRAVALGAGGTGTLAGDRDDRAVLRDFCWCRWLADRRCWRRACWRHRSAAVAVAAITVRANEENRLAALTKAKPLPQNRFAVNHRHASSQAGTGQRQWSRGRLEPALFGLPVDGCRTRNPAALTAGFHLLPALRQDTSFQPSLWMIGQMIAPSAR